MNKRNRNFGFLHKITAFVIVTLSAILIISNQASKSSAEYSSSFDTYASIQMKGWTPKNLTAVSLPNTGRCAELSWDSPDDEMYQYAVEWSKNTNFDPSAWEYAFSHDARPKHTIKGLELNTTYYARVYGVNNWNYEWSSVVKFTTSNKEEPC